MGQEATVVTPKHLRGVMEVLSVLTVNAQLGHLLSLLKVQLTNPHRRAKVKLHKWRLNVKLVVGLLFKVYDIHYLGTRLKISIVLFM